MYLENIFMKTWNLTFLKLPAIFQFYSEIMFSDIGNLFLEHITIILMSHLRALNITYI